MKKEKREKRYLYDVLNEIRFGFKMKVLIFLLIVIGTIVFAPLNFRYNPILNYDWREMYKSNNYTYKYLNEIASNVIQEKGITNIPEDIEYRTYIQNDNIVFFYYIKESNTYNNMKIILSKDFKIIDKKCSIELKTEEEYQREYKLTKKVFSYAFGLISVIVILLTIQLFICALKIISFIHKKLDEKKKNEKV